MTQALNIRTLRERIKWTQDRLARFLGVDRSSVSRMENGQPLSGPVLRLLQMLDEAAERGTADALCPEITTEAAE